MEGSRKPLEGNGNGEHPGRLDSWKEIAAYLKRHVRTVQRWEAERGMPVHRVPGGERSSVTALKSEIDEWYRSAENLDAPDDSLPEEANDDGKPPGNPTLKRRVIIGSGAAAILAVGGVALFRNLRESGEVAQARIQTSQPVRRFALVPESGFRDPKISPDGKMIAYVSGDDNRRLCIYHMANGETKEYPGTEDAQRPFWTPGSDFVAFASGRQLKKMFTASGVVEDICTLNNRGFRGGSWSPDGEFIIFQVAQVYTKDIFKVPANGGDPIRVSVELYNAQHPEFLSTGAGPPRLLFNTAWGVSQTRQWPPDGQIAIHDFQSRKSSTLGPGTSPVYSRTGHILVERNPASPAIWAIPISTSSFASAGEAFPVASNATNPSVSHDGVLVYREGTSARPVQLVWRDRKGKVLGRIGVPQLNLNHPRLSPDGRYVAASGDDNQHRGIWIHEVDQPKRRRFTFSTLGAHGQVWSPSGEFLVYSDNGSIDEDEGISNLRVKAFLDPSAKGEPLLPPGWNGFPSAWSRDGRRILFLTRNKVRAPGAPNSYEIWYLERVGDSSKFEAHRYFGIPQRRSVWPSISPDGRHVAYVSDHTGTEEVLVSPFPVYSPGLPITEAGGNQPVWSHDGGEIFYVEGDMLWSVAVKTSPTLSIGERKPLFRSEAFGGARPEYDVSPDGQRFVVAEPTPGAVKPVLRIVLNWFEEFRGK